MGLLLPFLCPQRAATWSLFVEEKRKTPVAAGTQDTQWAMFGSSNISNRKWKSRTFLPVTIEQTVRGTMKTLKGLKEDLGKRLLGHSKTVNANNS